MEDNGRGIPEDRDIFRKGVSTKGSDRGLGLYLIRNRIEEQGGTITLDSRPGYCCFSVYLPHPDLKETLL